ncbi:MAG: sigma-70 family RNA polymerase sigma factor [Verrucomicrobiota bacterium]
MTRTSSPPPRPLSENSDAELVEYCKQEISNRKLSAYQELLRRHETLVFSTCINMLNNVQDAEEVCQDAFLQVYNKIHQFEGRSSFKTWLYRIVYNLCLNRRKSAMARRNREHTAGETYAQEVETRQLSYFAATPDDRVPTALSKMGEKERQILRLRFVSDLSLNEISDFLELGLSATKMRLYRAMDEFKRIYTALPATPKTDTQNDHSDGRTIIRAARMRAKPPL